MSPRCIQSKDQWRASRKFSGKEVYTTPHKVTASFEKPQKNRFTHVAHQSVSPCRLSLAPSRWAWPSGRCSTCSPGNSVHRHRSVYDTEEFLHHTFSHLLPIFLLHPNPSGAAHTNSACWFGKKTWGDVGGQDGKHCLLLFRFSHLWWQKSRTYPVQKNWNHHVDMGGLKYEGLRAGRLTPTSDKIKYFLTILYLWITEKFHLGNKSLI